MLENELLMVSAIRFNRFETLNNMYTHKLTEIVALPVQLLLGNQAKLEKEFHMMLEKGM